MTSPPSRTSRSAMAPWAYRTALVTSSEASSSVVGISSAQAPAAQPPADQEPGAAGGGQLGRELPGDVLIRRQPVQPGQQDRDVVALVIGVDARQRGLAELLERAGGRSGAERLAQPGEALVDVGVAPLDEPVGVQHQQAAVPDLERPGLDRPRPDAERRGRRDVQELGLAVRRHEQRRQVAGRGHLAVAARPRRRPRTRRWRSAARAGRARA